MSTDQYALIQILVFILCSTTIGFMMGRAFTGPARPGSRREAPYLRLRIDALEARHVTLIEEKRVLVDRLAAGESGQQFTLSHDEADNDAEVERLRLELVEVNAEIDRLHELSDETDLLEARVASRDEQISGLEAALQLRRDEDIGIDLDTAAGDHGRTGGSGLVTDTVMATAD